MDIKEKTFDSEIEQSQNLQFIEINIFLRTNWLLIYIKIYIRVAFVRD